MTELTPTSPVQALPPLLCFPAPRAESEEAEGRACGALNGRGLKSTGVKWELGLPGLKGQWCAQRKGDPHKVRSYQSSLESKPRQGGKGKRSQAGDMNGRISRGGGIREWWGLQKWGMCALPQGMKLII